MSVQVKANVAAEKENNKLTYGGDAGVKWKPNSSVPINVTGGLGVKRIDQTLPSPMNNLPQRQSTTEMNFNLGLSVDF